MVVLAALLVTAIERVEITVPDDAWDTCDFMYRNGTPISLHNAAVHHGIVFG